MANKKAAPAVDSELEFDLDDLSHFVDDNNDYLEQEIAMDMANTFTRIYEIKLTNAIELTKLVLQHGKADTHKEKDVFQVFENALSLLDEHNPIPDYFAED